MAVIWPSRPYPLRCFYRAHAPLIGSLLNEVGLLGGSLQGLVPGHVAAAQYVEHKSPPAASAESSVSELA
ncbi:MULTISPECIES: hypothetical protein [Paraburkholderia]|jgi:hypothetical protein|uniref:hypothetical protein n=1 Tax=Paraburkholderia TaxID=1822464 RepID=UPI001CAB1533|nr:hypothetical protein [Paraburkholderia caribensis]GJH37749.1 hypothetical protein CBA19CS91_33350 [Paraburkholderia hospita]CAG9258101.1 hypothetical protein PCAR4_440057 [Paraburkholderia caribensis]